MKNKHLIFLGLLVCSSILSSCNGNSKSNDSNSNTETNNATDFNILVQDWNKAHSSKDVGVFSNLFNNTILFYGSQMDKNSCIESKLLLFKKNPDFYQQIQGDIQIDNINNTEVKCSFVKRVTVKQASTDYPSYLIFRKVGENWKIVTESDLVTDINLSKTKSVKIDIPNDAIKGDFNGDGILEYMWLVKPKIDDDGMSCIGNCVSYIKFSDHNIPYIKVEDCIDGTPSNEGDLNKNGGDEIGLLPGWFTSCWRGYHVWTFVNGKWVNAVEPFSTHCNQWEEGVKPIEIDLNRKSYVIIRYSEHTGDDIITKSKSVRIAK